METDSNKVKILFTSLDGPDYVRSIINIAAACHERGNDVCVTLRRKHIATVKMHDLKFIGFETLNPNYEESAEPIPIPSLEHSMTKVNMPPLDRLENWSTEDTGVLLMLLRELIRMDKVLRLVIKEWKPDVIVADTIYPLALFMEGKIPAIPISSSNAIGLWHESNYVSGTGLSVFADKNLWEKYREKEKPINDRLVGEFNRWYSNFGLTVADMHAHRAFAKYFGAYVCPEALDYTQNLGAPPSNWVRVDPVVKQSTSKFVIPEKLAKKPGKLVYISLGTITDVHVNILQTLINTFTKSKHRYIILKGQAADRIKLPRNMWGAPELDHLAVLKECDMVIGHGHCESIYESLYYSKPMMVMPLFFNQLDNAQRLEDLQLGMRVNPFAYDDSEILAKIERLLTDADLHARIKKISEQMQASDNRSKICEMIEAARTDESSPMQS